MPFPHRRTHRRTARPATHRRRISAAEPRPVAAAAVFIVTPLAIFVIVVAAAATITASAATIAASAVSVVTRSHPGKRRRGLRRAACRRAHRPLTVTLAVVLLRTLFLLLGFVHL